MSSLRYLVHGGELFQTQEAVVSIQHHCTDNGYNKHEVFEIVTGFDWSCLTAAVLEIDMFADKKLIELRLHSALTKSDQRAFEKVLEFQTQEIVILVVAKKLSPDVLKEGWVKKILHQGEVVEAKSIPSYQWPQWVAKRLQHMQITTTPDAFQLLSKSYEGNLFDLNQALLNIKANHSDQTITFDICKLYVTESNILSVFDLSNSIVQADCQRILTTIESLKNNHIEPTLILWSVTKELRLLIKLKIELQNNPTAYDDFLTKKYNIWQSNISKYKNLLKKNTLQDLHKLISFAYKIDLTIKGLEPGNIFELICILCFKLVDGNLNIVINEGVNA